MRAALAKAISTGAVAQLGRHSIVLGGAQVDADVYQVGDTIHVEVDCAKQSMTTRLGTVSMDGIMHMEMDVSTFRRISEAAQGYGPKLIAAAQWLTNRPPMLRSENE